jgi:hypothetical protein
MTRRKILKCPNDDVQHRGLCIFDFIHHLALEIRTLLRKNISVLALR